MSTQVVPVPALVFNDEGEVSPAPHGPVPASVPVAAATQTVADHVSRQSARRAAWWWLVVSEHARLIHIDTCEDLCDRCREYRAGDRTVNTQCGCGWVGDMPVIGTPDGLDEARCPVCLTSNYIRTED